MNTWNIRHAGSPRSLSGVSSTTILEGLRDGQWDPTDEVRGPNDADWTPLERHPHFAEAVLDLEPDFPSERPDETRLDMNPLIDVALVLLIFFILTATYQSLRRAIDVPGVTQEEQEGAAQVVEVPFDQIKEQVIIVAGQHRDGQTQLRIQEKPVEPTPEAIRNALLDAVEASGRSELLLFQDHLPWEQVVWILDAAEGAGITKVLWHTSETEQ